MKRCLSSVFYLNATMQNATRFQIAVSKRILNNIVINFQPLAFAEVDTTVTADN
jgi:hypothetical protein